MWQNVPWLPTSSSLLLSPFFFFFFTGHSNSSFPLSPNSFQILFPLTLSPSAFNVPSTTSIRSTIGILHRSSIRVLALPSKMRFLLEDVVDAVSKVKIAPKIYSWLFSCHGFWHNTLLIMSSLLFVLYLGVQAKKSFSKLSHGRSYIMMSYYGSLWLVSLLNLAWCSFQAWECTPGKEVPWNVLSLFTTTGMLFLEVSLVAFLFQGNYANGLEALTRTFIISGLVVGLDLFLKAIYLFGLGIPLFIDDEQHPYHMKWSLWAVHRLVVTAVYGCILCMYHSRWRERLPARPAFYRYIIVMFIVNALAVFACGLTGNGAGFGFWLYGATIVCYHAFYLPLLYYTFLADFFQEEDLHLENVYYSEMKDAGFLDSEWE